MSDERDDLDQDKDRGKLLAFPGGKTVSTGEVGTDYVIAQGGDIPTPEIVDASALAKEYKDRENFVEAEPLTTALSHGSPAPNAVDLVLKEIGEEIAHLKYERKKAIRDGKPSSNYTIARIASLRQLADVLIKRLENARAEQLDLKSPRMKAVLRLWMEFLYESMQKVGVKDQDIDMVFRQMEADMVDWERRVLESA